MEDYVYTQEDDYEADVAHASLLAWQGVVRETTFETPDDGGVYGLAPFAYTQVDEQYDLLAVSNFEVALRELREAAADEGDVEDLGVKFWVGSVRGHYLRVRLDDPDVVARLAELVSEVEDYPVLDDEDLTAKEDAELVSALQFYDDVDNDREASEVLAWLDEHHGWSFTYTDLPEEADVRRALLALGYVNPDPELGEEPYSSVEETALVWRDLVRQAVARASGGN